MKANEEEYHRGMKATVEYHKLSMTTVETLALGLFQQPASQNPYQCS